MLLFFFTHKYHHHHHKLSDQPISSPLAIEGIVVCGSFRQNPLGQSPIGNFLRQEFYFLSRHFSSFQKFPPYTNLLQGKDVLISKNCFDKY